jgi:hypothetical protein
MRLAYRAAVRLRGDKGADARARGATRGHVMGVEAWRVPARGERVKIAAARRRCGQSQRGHMGQPAGQHPLVMPPLGAVRGIRSAGRLREHAEPSTQPEGLLTMKVTAVPAACLLQPLQGSQTPQRARGGDHARAGLIRLGHALVQADAGYTWQAEQETCDPRAPAALGGRPGGRPRRGVMQRGAPARPDPGRERHGPNDAVCCR